MSTESLYQQFAEMVRGEICTISRDEFRSQCDEEDRVTYLHVARKIASINRCKLHVHEDNLEFICPPW